MSDAREIQENVAQAFAWANSVSGINRLPLPPRKFRREWRDSPLEMQRLAHAEISGLITKGEADAIHDLRDMLVRKAVGAQSV